MTKFVRQMVFDMERSNSSSTLFYESDFSIDCVERINDATISTISLESLESTESFSNHEHQQHRQQKPRMQQKAHTNSFFQPQIQDSIKGSDSNHSSYDESDFSIDCVDGLRESTTSTAVIESSESTEPFSNHEQQQQHHQQKSRRQKKTRIVSLFQPQIQDRLKGSDSSYSLHDESDFSITSVDGLRESTTSTVVLKSPESTEPFSNHKRQQQHHQQKPRRQQKTRIISLFQPQIRDSTIELDEQNSITTTTTNIINKNDEQQQCQQQECYQRKEIHTERNSVAIKFFEI